MYNFALGMGTGLYLTGFGIGLHNSLEYSNKIMQESYSQTLPHKLISYYGAFTCTFSMAVTTGFAFVASPILLPFAYSRKINRPLDYYDIISFVK